MTRAPKPIIGIPLSLDDCGQWRAGWDYEYIDTAYAAAVSAAGGVPFYIPVDADLDSIMSMLQGVLIPGGGDFVPDRPYPDHLEFKPLPDRRLQFDRTVLRHALDGRVPMLGICYGMQLLALEYGGTVLYDIPTDRADAGDHQLPVDDGRHAITVEPGTRLEAILGAHPGPVNSFHRQAVADPGDGLRISARTEDGIIEAVEIGAHPFCVGVQWHPEKMTGPHRTALFEAFVAACAAAAQG